MKKILFFALIATLGLASCTEKKIISVNETNEIGFASYLGNAATKGAEITSDNLDNFGVLAAMNYNVVSSTPNFMYNQLVEKSEANSSWTYTPVKYWPNNEDDTIQFWAYAPYSTYNTDSREGLIKVSKNNIVGQPYVDFTVSENIAEQVDFLVASQNQSVNKNSVKLVYDESGKVVFFFKHALSRIDIKVKADEDIDSATELYLTKLTVSGFASKGVKTLYGQSNDWEIAEDVDRLSFDIEGENVDTEGKIVISEGTKALPKDNYPVKGEYIPGWETEGSGYFFVIPENDLELTFTLDYNVITKDEVNPDNSAEFSVSKELTVTKTFDYGKAYVLKFNLGLDAIEFSAEVDDWAKGDEKEYNVPEKPQE